MLAAIAGATATGIATGNAVISGAFLVLPFATIIMNLFKPARHRSRTTKEDSETNS